MISSLAERLIGLTLQGLKVCHKVQTVLTCSPYHAALGGVWWAGRAQNIPSPSAWSRQKGTSKVSTHPASPVLLILGNNCMHTNTDRQIMILLLLTPQVLCTHITILNLCDVSLF